MDAVVEAIARHLEDEHLDIREATVAALCSLEPVGCDAVLNAIIRRLDHVDPGVRRAAVSALANVALPGDVRVMEALTKLLDDEDASVRWVSVETMGKLSTAGKSGGNMMDLAVDALARRLAEAEPCAGAVPPMPAGPLVRPPSAVAAAGQQDSEPCGGTVPPMPRASSAVVAADQLAVEGRQQQEMELAALEAEANVWDAALDAMQRISAQGRGADDAQTLEAIARHLGTESPDVQSAVWEVMGKVASQNLSPSPDGHPADTGQFIGNNSIYEDEDEESYPRPDTVRPIGRMMTAVHRNELATIHEEENTPRLPKVEPQAAASNGTAWGNVSHVEADAWLSAVEAMAKMSVPDESQTMQAIVHRLDCEAFDNSATNVAAQGYENMAVAANVNDGQYSNVDCVSTSKAYLIEKVCPTSNETTSVHGKAVDTIFRHFEHPDAGVRREAVRAMGRVAVPGDVKAQTALAGRLDDPDGYVRESAMMALSRLGMPPISVM